MNIDLVNFGITHLGAEIEELEEYAPYLLSGLTMGREDDLRELLELLEWCNKKGIFFIFGWRFIKMDNDVGSYYYRLCPSLSVANEKDAMLIKLSWPDFDLQITNDEEEE